MKKHTEIYCEYFGYGEQDTILCEVCGNICSDTHHISSRGMGGSKTKDRIENLIGLCRKCHNRAHFIEYPPLSQIDLTLAHKKKIDDKL
ncbi:MAG: HNH endonuclease [bacterium]|nr:HNH endonuclease [bacterium]